MAWDCPFDGPVPESRTLAVARRAVEMGADRLCLGGTIGTAAPARVVNLLKQVRLRHPRIPLGLHLHGTGGLAAVLAALRIGITDIDACIGGSGGCPSAPDATDTIATEELVHLCQDLNVFTGCDLGKLAVAARWARDAVGRDLETGILHGGGLRTYGGKERLPAEGRSGGR